MKQKKFIRNILVWLSLLACVGMTACDSLASTGSTSIKKTPSELNSQELTAWAYNTADVTKQVMDSEDIDADSKNLEVYLARGESEGVQLMLTAKSDITVKNVQVGRLKNGMAYIPNDDVDVYYCHYIELTDVKNNKAEFSIGDKVSEALFPMETAYEYGMNKVQAGHTQAIYIEVTTHSETIPGIYTTYVTFETNKHTYQMPISVKVWDYDIDNAVSQQNFFGINYRAEMFGSAELNSTPEMSQLYFEKALEYRMNCDLPFYGVGGPEKYVELLRKYYNWDNFSTYRLYYEVDYSGLNVPVFKEYLTAIVKASVEDRVNYLDKAVFFGGVNLVDEATTEAQFTKLGTIVGQFDESLRSVNKLCTQEYVGTSDYNYYSQIISNTLMRIPNLMTYTLWQCMMTIEDRGIQATNTVSLDFLVSETQRNQLSELALNKEYQQEYWYFTACYPLYPYMNNQLDDYNVATRILMWLQEAYDNIGGYLHWGYAFTTRNNGKNPYETPDHMHDGVVGDTGTFQGDGSGFYPGYPFGIEGPVASLRTVAIRDGVEDAETVNLLKEMYDEFGLSADVVLESYYSQLFKDVSHMATPELMIEVRASLSQLVESVADPLGLLYKSIITQGNMATVEFMTVTEDAQVFLGDTLLVAENGVYTVTLDLTTQSYLQTKVVTENSEKQHNYFVAGQYTLLDELNTEASLAKFRVSSESSILLNTNTDYVKSGYNASVQLKIKGKKNAVASYQPFFTMDVGNIDVKKVSTIGFMVYCDNESGMKFDVSIYNGGYYDTLCSINLEFGWNYVNISTDSIKKSFDGKLYFKTENILDEQGNEKTVNLYLNELYSLGRR